MAVSQRLIPRVPAVSQRLIPPASRRPEVLMAAVAIVASGVMGLAMVKLGSVQRDLKAILLLIAAAALALAALRPRTGLVILLALMPFDYGFSGTGTEQVLLPAMALVLCWRIRWRTIPGWVSAGGVALVLGSFISVIGAHDQTTALWGAVRWLAAVLVLFAAITLLRDERDAARRMLDIFTGGAVVVALFGLAQKAGVDVLVGPPYQSGLPNSFLHFYTNYAGYLAIAATLATGQLLASRGPRSGRRAATYALAVIIMVIGLAVALSRGGILALGVGLFVLLALNASRPAVLARGTTLLVVIIGGAYIATPASTLKKLETRVGNTVSGQTAQEDVTRFALIAAGEKALAKHPQGIGYGNFSLYLTGHARSSNITLDYFHAQNTPVEIGLDAGWLGLVGFLTLWGTPLVLMLVARRGAVPEKVRGSAFVAALCGLMAQGMYDYLFDEISFLGFFGALVWGAWYTLSPRRVAVASRSADPATGRAELAVGATV